MVTQAHRSMQFKSPLGADALLFRSFSGTEQLGRLFEYQVQLLSESPDLAPEKILGQEVTVSIERADGSLREFNGVVSRFSHEGPHQRMVAYGITMRPWLWLLTRTANCRIFQDKKVPDIIKEVCRDNGFDLIDDRLESTYREWPYCVQYRETDFNFVSRLMEQEGIYFFFSHDGGKHKLVLADAHGSHRDAAPDAKIPFFPPEPNERRDEDHIFDVSSTQRIQPGVYALDDYDFEKPRTDLKAKSAVSRSHSHAGFEIFDYPGEYKLAADGKSYVDARIQELQAQYDQIALEGNARGLAAGDPFTLEEDVAVHHGTNREYLITSAHYQFSTNEYLAGPDGAERRFHLGLQCIDARTPFRATRTTPKPVVQGPQTAVVVGKSGEEIWTDKYGRVKVQFHWDRFGKNDENSSCWVRVAQVWAGKNWGAIHIPRMGQEVIVDFLEGDPDQPIVTGRVYNADNMPPYALPDNQTQSGIKSRSTKEGAPDNFNEIRFEDKKGAEELYIHAERNFTRIVENDDSLKVGFSDKDKGDQTIDIHNNQVVTVGNSKSDDGSQTIAIHNNQVLTVGNSESDDGSQTITVWKDRTITLETGNDALTVSKGNRTIKVDAGNRTTTLGKGNDKLKLSGGSRETTISKGNDKLSLGMGNIATEVKMGKIDTKAMQSIELKVGANSLKIDQSGVTIKGIMVKIQGTAMTDIKAPMTQVKGDGMLILKGGMTLIN